ncbi:MAG: DUF1501 domain-containing protein [Planctomycetaceae bacterium]|nr:DUF1501 domain-containing protein [Planctomycetaceae bacterium]
MLELTAPFDSSSRHRTCDGITRRTALRIGGLGVGGLSLPSLLRQQAAGSETPARGERKAVILVWLAGGPSHLDMYDLKPDAPVEIRGEFRPITTSVPGMHIGEHLPLQAQIADRLSIVRSAFHTNAGHGMGAQWMQTGWQPTIEVNDNIYPSIGSVTAKMVGAGDPGLPAYVNLPNPLGMGKAAYLGAQYNPFSPGSSPNSDSFEVRNLRLPGQVPEDRLRRRHGLLSSLDNIRRDVDTEGEIAGIDRFYRDAVEMVTSDKARKAFNIQAEDDNLREEYGRNDLGQSCLLARRLVEAGVTFVAIQAGGGWDTHGNNFTQLKDKLLPQYDRAVTALVKDLSDRGLADNVLVTSFGEFGRTPKINSGAGRDHWPGAMSVLYAGGGLKMGQVVGATNSTAEYPTKKAASPGCVLSTIYHVLGIDYRHAFYDHARRPLQILAEGRPIEDLI